MSEDSKENPKSSKLQRITEIEILGRKFDLAKNGGYKLCLVESDAYGNPRAEEIQLWDVAGLVEWTESLNGGANHQAYVMQALLNLAGDALVRLQSHRDARLGTSGEGEK
jgi:hypothetical protein